MDMRNIIDAFGLSLPTSPIEIKPDAIGKFKVSTKHMRPNN